VLLLLTIPFVVVFYLLLIRPQQQRVREHEALVAGLGVGDRVITAGGLHGTIVALDDETVDLEAAPGVVLTFARAAIAKPAAEPDAPDALDADDEPREDGR